METNFDHSIPLEPSPAVVPSQPASAKPSALRPVLLTVLGLLSLAAVGFGGYWFGSQQAASRSVADQVTDQTQTDRQMAPTETQETTATPTVVTLTLPFANLEEFVASNCKMFQRPDGSATVAFDPKNFPLASPQMNDLFPSGTPTQVDCVYGEMVNESSLRLGFSQPVQRQFIMYGPASTEGGHGGQPDTGKFGGLLREKGTLSTRIYITPPHACGYDPESLNLRARVIRELKAQDGSSVWIQIDEAIAPNAGQELRGLYSADIAMNEGCEMNIIDLQTEEVDRRATEFVRALPETNEIQVAVNRMELELASVVLKN